MDVGNPAAAQRRGSWGARLSAAAIIAIAIVLVFVLARRVILGLDRFTIERTRPILSKVDGLQYRVHLGHAGAQRAADMLARLNGKIIDLMRALRDRYVRGPAGEVHPERRAAVERLLARYNPDNLAENSPKDPSGDTSYTLDKGAVIALCLREKGRAPPTGDRAADDLHDMDTLLFVALHEMAHVAIDDVDHPPRFWSAFRFILDEAEDTGVYTSPDFARAPRQYCGVKIDYNPRHDGNTISI